MSNSPQFELQEFITEIQVNWQKYIPGCEDSFPRQRIKGLYRSCLKQTESKFITRITKEEGFCAYPIWKLNALRFCELKSPKEIDSKTAAENVLYDFKEALSLVQEELYPYWLNASRDVYQRAFSEWINTDRGAKHTIFTKYWSCGNTNPTTTIKFKNYCKTAIGFFTMDLIRTEQNPHIIPEPEDGIETIPIPDTQPKIPASLSKGEAIKIAELVKREYPESWEMPNGEMEDTRWQRQMINDENTPLEDYLYAALYRFRYLNFQDEEFGTDAQTRNDVIKLIGDYYTLTLKESALHKKHKNEDDDWKKKNYGVNVEAYIENVLGSKGLEYYMLLCVEAQDEFYHVNHYTELHTLRAIMRHQKVILHEFSNVLDESCQSKSDEEFRTWNINNVLQVIDSKSQTDSRKSIAAFLLMKEMNRLHQAKPIKFHRQIKLRIWYLILSKLPVENLTPKGKIVLGYKGGAEKIKVLAQKINEDTEYLTKYLSGTTKPAEDSNLEWNKLVR